MIRTVHEVLLLWLCVEFVFLLVSGSLQKETRTHTHTHSASESSRSKAKERRGFEREDVRTARPEPKPCFFAWGSALAALEPWGKHCTCREKTKVLGPPNPAEYVGRGARTMNYGARRRERCSVTAVFARTVSWRACAVEIKIDVGTTIYTPYLL